MTWALSLSILVSTAPLFGGGVAAQGTPTLQGEVQRWRKSHEAAILSELADFVRIPNLASDKSNIDKNAEHLMALLRRRGIEARLLQEPGAPPVVFGQLAANGANHTVVFYAHYDGQPVDPAQWKGSPWTPVLRDKPVELGGKEIPFPAEGESPSDEARLYGRSSSDDKGPIIALVSALDALRAASAQPSVNLKFFFDGEEEAESPHLRGYLEHNRDLLKADGWIFCDGPVHQSRRAQLVYGVRGILGLDLTVYGATRTLHSGHYGNWAPNPATLLAHLIAGMRDDNGRVLIAGFYDAVRPPTKTERLALSSAPKVDPELRKSLGLARTEANNAALAERIMAPGMNVRGLQAGHVGTQSTAAIPTEAMASIDFRLVPEQRVDSIKAEVERHVRNKGYYIVSDAPDETTRLSHPLIARLHWKAGGYPGVRTAMDLPLSRAVAKVVREVANAPVVELPNMGGSLPLYLLTDVLATPFVILPIVNHDNNQHASNENLRLRNLWDGIDVFAALFVGLETAWGGERALR